MAPLNYNPDNWYWVVGGSTTEVYSSASISSVPITDSTYVTWLAEGNTPTTIDSQGFSPVLADIYIRRGLAVTSSTTPSLNATYATDTSAQEKLNAVTTYIVVNSDFPGGSSTMPWYDKSGTAHTFPSVAMFKLFATAIANYVAEASLYADSAGTSSLPSATVALD